MQVADLLFLSYYLSYVVAERPVLAVAVCRTQCYSFKCYIFNEQEGRLEIRSSSTDRRMSFQLVNSHLGLLHSILRLVSLKMLFNVNVSTSSLMAAH